MNQTAQATRLNTDPEQPRPVALHQPPTDRLFMKPKDFAALVGVPYTRVIAWIAQDMPVMPECKSPYWVIVPAALDWLHQRYGF